ncbi:membrane-spanning 4-domains subfamily A member 4A-like [Tiliqua scincoides]|uniref:membrane-spanning 4-domains subfamily A member 4A-like n=1 Tax=Tiliqua scincoides TaxID=71010 RepID=UPI003461BC02
MDRDNSGVGLSTQIVTQQPQLFANSGMRSSRESPLIKFYKGEPLALGITQILTGILGITFGLVLDLVNDHSAVYILVKAPYWTGIPYILSGSLSVAAARNPKKPIVKSMLGMNVLSAVAAGLGILILSISLPYFDFSWYSTSVCDDVDVQFFRQCYEHKVIPEHIQKGMMAIFLVFSMLEFCISISGAAFGCKALCQETFVETVVVIYQSTAPPGNAVSPPSGVQGL